MPLCQNFDFGLDTNMEQKLPHALQHVRAGGLWQAKIPLDSSSEGQLFQRT